MVGYGDNLNWCWHAVYLQWFSGRSLCTWSATYISGTRPSVNECPSWSDMENISHYCIFNYGARTGFQRIYVFSLIYTTDHIFPVLPITQLVNHNGEPTMPHKLATSTKPSLSNLHILFFSCVLQKATAHVDTKALKMRHQSQNIFGLYSLEFHNIK